METSISAAQTANEYFVEILSLRKFWVLNCSSISKAELPAVECRSATGRAVVVSLSWSLRYNPMIISFKIW